MRSAGGHGRLLGCRRSGRFGVLVGHGCCGGRLGCLLGGWSRGRLGSGLSGGLRRRLGVAAGDKERGG